MKHTWSVKEKPIDAYLDIEGIIDIAKRNKVDAIHPGYGFLSENIHFAKRCEEEGIVFIGPKSEHLDMFGDKVKAREQAEKAGIPVIPGSDGPAETLEAVEQFGQTNGYPIIIKASLAAAAAVCGLSDLKVKLKKHMSVQNQRQKQPLAMMKCM